ncbi:MAG: hypothetical protein KDC43_04495 [Saprospiraceae bacterium]|nr:hypothetical protein [Saprospiraceae bacterium]MCB0623183.1 hypothetical protein [Saprospiraceae bacterium]MCB0683369.1 hypothetical protein [Saprospiraceae bacterium]
MAKRSFLFALLLFPLFLFGQNPTTNIYLFHLEQTEGKVVLSQPRYLTGFNARGYNNQPYFFSNEELYISVQTPEDTSQTEIYSLQLTKGERTRITATPEAEYSPVLMPNYYYFSAVRVERDPDRTQRLWQFPLDRMDKGKPIFPYIRNIGYYYWVNSRNVLLYIVNEPNMLVIANTLDGSHKKITTNVGRCFQRLNNGNIAFIKKEDNQKWTIEELNPTTLEFKPIIGALQGSEDFVILRDGTFLMGRGSKLFQYHPTKDEGWTEVVDLSHYRIQSITRLAVSADGKLALVAQ